MKFAPPSICNGNRYDCALLLLTKGVVGGFGLPCDVLFAHYTGRVSRLAEDEYTQLR